MCPFPQSPGTGAGLGTLTCRLWLLCKAGGPGSGAWLGGARVVAQHLPQADSPSGGGTATPDWRSAGVARPRLAYTQASTFWMGAGLSPHSAVPGDSAGARPLWGRSRVSVQPGMVASLPCAFV